MPPFLYVQVDFAPQHIALCREELHLLTLLLVDLEDDDVPRLERPCNLARMRLLATSQSETISATTSRRLRPALGPADGREVL